MDLNPAQASAAHDAERHVLVEAGAGTGKTHCVVGRLLYVLGEEVAGQRIDESARLDLRELAAITFTNVAAADLQRKLRDALRAAGRGRDVHRVDTARIGTIHSFCAGVLREFALELPRAPALEALDEAEAAALCADAAAEALLAAVECRDLPGLDRLLAEWRVDQVEGWVARLAADADRLAHLRRDPDPSEGERVILELGRRALARLRRRLDQRGAIDFDAMIGLTRDLLRDRADVCRVLRSRIRLLVIDEFQDVDPAQQEIAWLLGDPTSGRPDATRLMLVGDPKQSIFRFRRADVAVWTRVRREFEAGAGALHRLTENYRSLRPILGFVDAVLGPELDQPVDPQAGRADYEVPYQPLVATAAKDTAAPCVEVLVLPPTEKGTARSGEAAREVEVPAMAARIAELVAGGARPGDVAILLSAWAPAGRYRAALAKRGIASWTLRNEGYWERREVLDCVVALQALLDPLDDLALFGFLRGPMVGVRDETLLALARAARPPYWNRLRGLWRPGDLPADVGGHEPDLLAFGAMAVGRLGALRDRISHDELLEALLDQTGYLAHLRLLGDDGRQAEANVRKLVRKLRAWRRLTLREVLHHIAEVRERDQGSGEGDAPQSARADAVTITSIHGAKGLEWPVVVWADLCRGACDTDWHFAIGRDAVRLRSVDAERPDDDPRFAALRRAEALEERAQRKRLWYVAATRARERLIVAGVPLGEYGARLAGAAAECVRRLGPLDVAEVRYRDHQGAEFQALARVAELPAAAPTVAAPLPVLPATVLAPPRERLRVPAGRTRHSASELLTFSRCARKHWFAYVAGVPEPPVDRTRPAFVDAVTRGQIVHDVLEHLREMDELDGLLEDAIGRWDPDAPSPEAVAGGRYRGVLRQEIDSVAGDPAYRAVADLPGARRELGFVRLLGEGRELVGRIDLAAPREDGVVLLDVKTGGPASPGGAGRRAEAYAPQRSAYVSAIEAVAGRPVAIFAFQFSRAGTQVAEVITPELRARAATELEAKLDVIEAGERGLTASRRACWFCGYRRVGWCEGVPGRAKAQ